MNAAGAAALTSSTSAPWPLVRLGEVLAHRKEFIQIDDTREYIRCRVQLHAKGIVLRDRVEGALIKTKDQQVCRAGEFLVAEIDAKVGGFGVVPPDLDGSIVSSHYFLFAVDPHRLDQRFLDYYSKTPTFRDQVRAQGSTNYAAIRPTHVLGYTVPLPPLPEQRRIVAKLDRLSERIDEAKTLREAANRGSQSLQKQAAAAALDVVAHTSTLEPLGDLVTIRGGGTPSKTNPLYWEGSIPWITPKDMKRRALTDAIDHISADATAHTAAKLLDPGCVLVVVRGMILAHTVPSAVLGAPAAINQDMKALIPSPRVLPEYLCGVLWAWNARLLKLVERSTHDTRKLETDKLLGFRFPVLPVGGQQEVLARLEALEVTAAEAALSQSATDLELGALMPAILDRAFKGGL